MTTNVDYLPIYLSELSRQTANITLFVQIVIGFVTLIFTLGGFLVWRENKAVIKAANDQLRSIESKKVEIDGWHEEKKCSLDQYLKDELDKFASQVEEVKCYQTIIMGMESAGRHVEAVYSSVCYLSERPSQLYAAVFRELIKKDYSKEITERARVGLRNWEKVQKLKPRAGSSDPI